MKAKFLENKKIAIIAAAAMIFISVLLLGGVKLRRDRDKVQELFYSGVEKDSLSIYNDLAARAESSQNLVTIAAKYLDANAKEITSVQTACKSLLELELPSEMYNANHDLTVAVDALYSKIADMKLSEEDSRLASKQFTELSSRNQTISHDGFNGEASRFNTVMKSFPASLITAVNGIERVDLFR